MTACQTGAGGRIKTHKWWSGALGEALVAATLLRHGLTPRPARRIGSHVPDWETNDFVIEVKTRNWTTSGTIGEKTLGSSLKYNAVPHVYKKPLLIVCVAYQEEEFTNGPNKIFGSDICPYRRSTLDFLRDVHHIDYVPFSKLVEYVGNKIPHRLELPQAVEVEHCGIPIWRTKYDSYPYH